MKVIFLEPEGFLRTPQRTNPFLDPIIWVCDKSGFDWEIWMPSRKTVNGYDPGRVRSYGTFSFARTVIYRILHYVLCVSAAKAKRWTAYIAGRYLLRRMFSKHGRPDLIISLSGFLVEDLYCGLPNVRAIDVQHGVIYSRHSGYFDRNGRTWHIYWRDRFVKREFWVYGQGYAECFFKHPDNIKDLQCRVKVIGDVIRAGEKVGVDSWSGRDEARDVVVFSLQLTADLSQDELSGSVERMEAFFTDFFAKYGDKYKCFVKHHPRFNNVYDLSAFYAKFPQVTETKVPWTELYPKMALHVTFNSTVTFDCASQGIPTFLVDFPEAKIIMRSFYRDDYGYPFYDKSVDDILGSPIEEARRTIIDWYHRFYTPFSEENCRRLLYGGESYKE